MCFKYNTRSIHVSTSANIDFCKIVMCLLPVRSLLSCQIFLKGGRLFMSTYVKPKSDEARIRANARQRAYRQAHPDKAKEWRERYILRKADQLRAQQAQPAEGGEQE